jgi:hypothetical protein
MRGISFALALLALALAPAAAASNGPVPWAGGAETVTEFEARAQAVLGELIGQSIGVYCNDEATWEALFAGTGQDPGGLLGLVPSLGFRNGVWVPAPYTQLAPDTCWYPSEWTYAADRRAEKWCVTGSRTEYRTETRTETSTELRTRTKTVWKRKKVRGRWTRVRTRVAVRVPVVVQRTVEVLVPYEVGLEEVCDDYELKLMTWETFTHEAVHVRGIVDEAVAECFGMQLMAYFMFRMGTEAPLAIEAATDYATLLYERVNPTDYVSSECRPGGALDLQPERPEWPAIVAPGARGVTPAAGPWQPAARRR